MSAANLEFEIEELVLHGFSSRDRHLIGAAMQQELTRLLTERRGLSPTIANSVEIQHLNGGTFEVISEMPPAAIGIQIAQSIYTCFSHEHGNALRS